MSKHGKTLEGNVRCRFLRPAMTTGQTIRAIPANAVPQVLTLPRVPVSPALATSPRPATLMLPNQPVPPREVFQRPLPPSNIRPQMVRAILIPRPGLSPSSQQQPQTVIISPSSAGQLQPQAQQQQQRLQSVNTGTPLPSISLPSEPLPMSAEMQQHLSSLSSPSPSPSPSSLDQPSYVQIQDGSQNGFAGNGSAGVPVLHLPDGVAKQQQHQMMRQQNPQKILIQVCAVSLISL